jgi:hypothetical protein
MTKASEGLVSNSIVPPAAVEFKLRFLLSTGSCRLCSISAQRRLKALIIWTETTLAGRGREVVDAGPSLPSGLISVPSSTMVAVCSWHLVPSVIQSP